MDHPIRNRLLVLFGMVVLGTLAVFTCKGFPRHVPTVHGRIVDGQTGAPLKDVFIAHQLYRRGSFRAFDTSAPDSVRGSYGELHTDSDGRFTLPGGWALAPSGIGWIVFLSGHMPATFCYARPSWTFGGCPGINPWYPDPWVQVTYTYHGSTVDADIRLFRPTLDGVTFWAFSSDKLKYVPIPTNPNTDPWARYFDLLSRLVQLHWLKPEVFVDEASRAIEDRNATEKAFATICSAIAEFYLGSTVGGSPCWKAELAWRLLEIESKACEREPSWEPCNSGLLIRQRANLERNCSQFGR